MKSSSFMSPQSQNLVVDPLGSLTKSAGFCAPFSISHKVSPFTSSTSFWGTVLVSFFKFTNPNSWAHKNKISFDLYGIDWSNQITMISSTSRHTDWVENRLQKGQNWLSIHHHQEQPHHNFCGYSHQLPFLHSINPLAQLQCVRRNI